MVYSWAIAIAGDAAIATVIAAASIAIAARIRIRRRPPRDFSPCTPTSDYPIPTRCDRSMRSRPVRAGGGMEHRRTHPYKSSMPQFNRAVITILAALAASIAAAGCAATQVPETPIERAQRIEPMLNAAGFRVLPADTPERRSQLASMTPLQIRFTPH